MFRRSFVLEVRLFRINCLDQLEMRINLRTFVNSFWDDIWDDIRKSLKESGMGPRKIHKTIQSMKKKGITSLDDL